MWLNPDVVCCNSSDCSFCDEYSDSACWETRRKPGDDRDLVVLEPEKGFVHICTSGLPALGPPSVHKKGWESIYLGEKRSFITTTDKILGLHFVGPYLLVFQEGASREEIVFRSFPLLRTPLENSLLTRLLGIAGKLCQEDWAKREDITDYVNRVASSVDAYVQDTIPEMSGESRRRLSEISAHCSSVIGPLIPILLDEMTEEVFLDSPEKTFYFDHQIHGRCQTSVVCKLDTASEIVTMLRAQSNLHLDSSNPSLKANLDLIGVPLRVSASIPPLSPDGLHLEIRRARLVPFGFADLVKNDTLSVDAAALLILALANRFNITVTGEPGSGKTTLLNAMDMVIPKMWRRVYVEDAIESRYMSDTHQVRFRVDPVDEQLARSSKSDEIVKCLHRSPDYVVLGEIQTKEHSEALFHALAAGLRVIQTCHSSSASALVSRWITAHGIEPVSIGLMDLVVTLRRPKPGESRRVVKEIAEVCRTSHEGLMRFSGLNYVYTEDLGLTKSWSEDGAFLRRAREYGQPSHLSALKGLIRLFRERLRSDVFAGVCEMLWDDNDPMSFSYGS